MIELKSKKTGKTEIISNEVFAGIKDHPMMSRFTITQLNSRVLIPSIKIEPKIETKKVEPKNKK